MIFRHMNKRRIQCQQTLTGQHHHGALCHRLATDESNYCYQHVSFTQPEKCHYTIQKASGIRLYAGAGLYRTVIIVRNIDT